MTRLLRTTLALIASSLALGAHAAEPGTYVATPADRSVAAMVQRWTTDDYREIVWLAPYDVPLGDPERVNKLADLRSATTALSAVQRLSGFLAGYFPELTPLHFCVFRTGRTAIVVRPITESCSIEGDTRRAAKASS